MQARQVMIAFSTMLVLAMGYGLYSLTLGQLTDFPQLAEALRHPMPLDGSQELAKPTVRESEVAAVRGFGPSCPQTSTLMTLDLSHRMDRRLPPGRGVGTYIYFDTYEILKENRRQVRVRPFSFVHIAHSSRGVPEEDEIMTAQAHEAILEFDRAISMAEFDGTEPIAGWIEGDVTLKTNRKTVNPSDDIVLFTDKLHYDRSKRLIWADSQVKITVEQEGTITGKGVEVELYSEEASQAAAPAESPPGTAEKKKQAGAKLARIVEDVRFELLVSAQENFLGGPVSKRGSDPAAELEKKAQEKSSVVISARGPFVYDLEKSAASFSNMVRVLRREPPKGKEGPDAVDHLEADQLVLQFGKRETKPSAGTASDPSASTAQGAEAEKSDEMHIEHAVATGSKVILLSEAQKLEAIGNFLQFDAADRRVTLRGEQEMIAVQNNAVIHARSLLIEQGEGSDPRRIIAEGPNGWMELNEEASKETPEKKKPLEIHWQDKLVMDKNEDADNFAFQITGSVEVEHDSWALTCQKLKGLLAPIETAPTVVPGQTPRRRLEPIKLEADGAVSFHSPQVVSVSETLLMDIVSRREPAPPKILAAQEDTKTAPTNGPASPSPDGPAPSASTVAANSNLPGPPLPADQGTPIAATPNSAGADVSSKPPAPAGPPITLQSRTLAIVVERVGAESRPVSAWAEGSVRVSQPPKSPGDRPIEIVGNQLEFQRHGDGDVMSIRGTDEALAEIRTSEMTLAARHRILMNEAANRVEIAGPGYLTMQTSNSLSGEASAQPMPIRVDWKELMNFDGKIAFFEGKVVAQQENNEIHSKTLEVTFDRKLNFRSRRGGEANGTEPQPKIENVFCEQDVQAFSREMKSDTLIRKTRLMSDQIRFDNVEGTVTIDGRGSVTIVEPNPPKKKASTEPALPFRVTIVEFADRLAGGQASQTVKFFGDVNILHVPVNDPSKDIDRDKLPTEGFEIVAKSAEMSQAQDPQGQKYRLFSARDNVKVRSKEYSATCGRVSFDEQKSMLVFEGERDRPAYFRREGKPGQPAPTIPARTIRYNQATGEIQTDGSEGFNAIDIGGPTGRPNTRR